MYKLNRGIVAGIIVVMAICFLGKSWADEDDQEKFLLLKDGSRVIKIEVGSNRSNVRDLTNRVLELEEAVRELQQHCYEIVSTPKEVWTCHVQGQHDSFYGTGSTKGLAEKDAMDKCRDKDGDSFFCRMIECSNQ